MEINLTGKTFGRLTVTSFEGSLNNNRIWTCQCRCGSKKSLSTYSLTSGMTKSCGCLHREGLIERNKSHGLSKSRQYKCWRHMIERCFDKNNKDAKHYMERGISCCKKWKTFEGFWDDMKSSYSDGLTLERVDNSMGYSKENCKWATRSEQSNNTRRCRFISFRGRTMNVSQWARSLGMRPSVLFCRMFQYGWSIEKSLTTPLNESKRNFGKRI